MYIQFINKVTVPGKPKHWRHGAWLTGGIGVYIAQGNDSIHRHILYIYISYRTFYSRIFWHVFS